MGTLHTFHQAERSFWEIKDRIPNCWKTLKNHWFYKVFQGFRDLRRFSHNFHASSSPSGPWWIPGKSRKSFENQENPRNTSENHLFSKPVLGLKNASFANRGHQTYANELVLGGTFFLELGGAKSDVFSKEIHLKISQKCA